MRIGLRVDVDTLRGTRQGVPALRELFARHGIRASFFFSVGPDNMGRHLTRLLRPSFLWKMLRTGAPSLYGWDVLLAGTLGPGKRIGQACREEIRAVAKDGHESGLHAWDHHGWQAHVHRMSETQIEAALWSGIEALTDIVGETPRCAAAPGWRTCDRALAVEDALQLDYASDCRGGSIFRPEVDGKVLGTIQVPVTLPTYDELIGRGGVSDENYNAHLLALARPDRLNVLCIHAEVEGLSRAPLFDDFIAAAHASGARFVPLGQLIEGPVLASARVVSRTVPGREGSVSCQGDGSEERGDRGAS